MVPAFGETTDVCTLKMLQFRKKRKAVFETNKKNRTEFRLLMALSPLIHANMNKASTYVMLSSEAIPLSRKTLHCPFKRFHELQIIIVSNVYNALSYGFNVQDVARKLNSKWRWLGICCALRPRAHA